MEDLPPARRLRGLRVARLRRLPDLHRDVRQRLPRRGWPMVRGLHLPDGLRGDPGPLATPRRDQASIPIPDEPIRSNIGREAMGAATDPIARMSEICLTLDLRH